MWSPCPERAARRAAAATAIAENVPASHSLVRPPAWNGTLRTEPRPTSPPDSACTMNSVVGRSAYGPVRPYGVIEHTIRPGCASRQRCGSSWDGGKLSITTSAPATRSSTSGSPGRPSTERIPWCRNWNSAPPSSGSMFVVPADHPRPRAPAGGLALDDVGAAIGEQPGAVAAGDSEAEIDDAQRRQSLLHGSA